MFFSVFAVALLAEGVDRNMRILWDGGKRVAVALLAEGVDRNGVVKVRTVDGANVALLAEGVDRNIVDFWKSPLVTCRPPRGGRG